MSNEADSKKLGVGFPLSAADGTAKTEVLVGEGNETQRHVTCEASGRMTGVPELLAWDWAILSRDIRSMLGSILIVTVVSSTEATLQGPSVMGKSFSSFSHVGYARGE